MVSKSGVTVDFTGVPGAASAPAIVAAIDTFLTTPAWNALEASRSYTVTWANFGGYTANKDRLLRAVLDTYRAFGGWNISIEAAEGQTAWTVTFARE